MAKECVQFLDLRAGSVYVDATTGGGGHSLEMLNACPEIKLFCFDQDAEALATAQEAIGTRENVELIKANFVNLRTELAYRKIKGIDGILFDLGVSSHQLDNASRGFSFDKNAPLDMRMDRNADYSAFNAVNELSSDELTRIFKEYSEELNSKRIANAIERSAKPINTTKELAKIIESVVGTGSKESLKSKVRIFQALRIHVNRELDYLQTALQDAINLLNPGGRIVVMSYHSLEDRIVKHTFRLASTGCTCPPAMIICSCDHKQQLIIKTKSPISASDEELAINPRSRSAKLRVAEKLGRGKQELPEKRFTRRKTNKGDK
jgi:16S rRNA (cytosine1402-N4)-methyltransferase